MGRESQSKWEPARRHDRFNAGTLFYAGTSTFPGTRTMALTGLGTAAPVPAAAIDPATIDFGEVVLGSPSAQKTITLANPGNALLQVSSFGLTGQQAGEFSLAGTCLGGTFPLKIGPNGSCTVVVEFRPQGLEQHTAELRVQHNAAGSPGLVVLTGVGVAATCQPPAPPGRPQNRVCGKRRGPTSLFDIQRRRGWIESVWP